MGTVPAAGAVLADSVLAQGFQLQQELITQLLLVAVVRAVQRLRHIQMAQMVPIQYLALLLPLAVVVVHRFMQMQHLAMPVFLAALVVERLTLMVQHQPLQAALETPHL